MPCIESLTNGPPGTSQLPVKITVGKLLWLNGKLFYYVLAAQFMFLFALVISKIKKKWVTLW